MNNKKNISPYLVAVRISVLSPKEASIILKKFLTKYDGKYVQNILYKLQDYNRKLHGSDDSWWLEMIYEAGESINKFF